jgi:transcription factor-like protein
MPTLDCGTSSSYLLHHFHSHWAEISQTFSNREIFSRVKSDPLVQHTILALSACHLRHLSPSVIQHRIAEYFQLSLALQYYQNALYTPKNKLGQFGVDSLLLSAVMLNMMAFALPQAESDPEPDPNTSWVFSSGEDRLGWLALQTGLRPLMLSMMDYFLHSMDLLGYIFLGGDKDSWATTIKYSRCLEEIPNDWIQMFNLVENSGGCDSMSENDVFRPPVSILAKLRHVTPVRSNTFVCLQFLSKVHPEFRRLLYHRDERALWIFGYWLGLMCRFKDTWWCEKRVKRDYIAISMCLKQRNLPERGGDEGKRWEVMMKEFEVVRFQAAVNSGI